MDKRGNSRANTCATTRGCYYWIERTRRARARARAMRGHLGDPSGGLGTRQGGKKKKLKIAQVFFLSCSLSVRTPRTKPIKRQKRDGA